MRRRLRKRELDYMRRVYIICEGNFYLDSLEDNLYLSMSDTAKASYGQGSGNEIASGKMNALRSPSVMTYNLFWNHIAESVAPRDSIIGSGIYQVELEK